MMKLLFALALIAYIACKYTDMCVCVSDPCDSLFGFICDIQIVNSCKFKEHITG